MNDVDKGCCFNGIDNAKKTVTRGPKGTIQKCNEFADNVATSEQLLLLLAGFLEDLGGEGMIGFAGNV